MPVRKATLLEDLEILLKKESQQIENMDMIHRLFLAKNNIHKVAAQKLIDDLNGKSVIYTDWDFLTARSKKSPIHKLVVKHKHHLPKQFVEQRNAVTNEHLDGVIQGSEREQFYVSV